MKRFSFSPLAFSVALHAGAAGLFLVAARRLPVSPFSQSNEPMEVALIEPNTNEKPVAVPEAKALPREPEVKNSESEPNTYFAQRSFNLGRPSARNAGEPQRNSTTQLRRPARSDFHTPGVRANAVSHFSPEPQRARVANASAAPRVTAVQKSPQTTDAPRSASQAKVFSGGVAPAPQSSRPSQFDVPVNQSSLSTARSPSPRDGGFGDYRPRTLPAAGLGGNANSNNSNNSASGPGGQSQASFGSVGESPNRSSGTPNNAGFSGSSESKSNHNSGDDNGSGHKRGDDPVSTHKASISQPKSRDEEKPQKQNLDKSDNNGRKRGTGRGSRVEIDNGEADRDVLRRTRRPAKIKARIKAKGDVEFSLEESSGDHDFDQKSLEIVRKGRYKPKTNDRGEAEDTERIIKVKPQESSDE